MWGLPYLDHIGKRYVENSIFLKKLLAPKWIEEYRKGEKETL